MVHALVCATAAAMIAGVYMIFNPYLSFKPKTEIERWTTRERSYGHPYYFKLRYSPDQYIHHSDVYNRPSKQRCYPRTTMYLE